ncbi:hypothetical protein PINS_up017507 [Pythium insidiosum]|nr:hypothetical protein PINS_up017507 [Pythium insidiosum]
MEAIVQSTKGPGSSDPSDTFQGPIVVEKDQPGSGRRLADAKSQFDLMFCDVGGNAIWEAQRQGRQAQDQHDNDDDRHQSLPMSVTPPR